MKVVIIYEGGPLHGGRMERRQLPTGDSESYVQPEKFDFQESMRSYDVTTGPLPVRHEYRFSPVRPLYPMTGDRREQVYHFVAFYVGAHR